MKKFLIGGVAGALLLGAMILPSFAKDDVANIKAPFYTVNNCNSDQVTNTLAGGQVIIVNPDGKTNLILQGEVRNLKPNTKYQVWVRNLSGGYTGSFINQYTPLGYYDLISLTTNKQGNGFFHFNFTGNTLKAGNYTLQVALNYDNSTTYGCTQIATQKNLSVTIRGEQYPIELGPVSITGKADTGTCNNTWALDNYKKYYTLTLNSDGTYHLLINYKDGTFVSQAGSSPGACESGSNNGNTIGSGVTGTLREVWNENVTATNPPNQKPDCGVNNVNCSSYTSFLDAVFGAGNWHDGGFPGTWTEVGYYNGKDNGTWFDTFANWPLNDKGDITGNKNTGESDKN